MEKREPEDETDAPGYMLDPIIICHNLWMYEKRTGVSVSWRRTVSAHTQIIAGVIPWETLCVMVDRHRKNEANK